MEKLAKEIMSDRIISIEPQETLFEALQIMRKFGIRHLPVTEKNSHKVSGLLSEGDIVLYCKKDGEKLAVDSDIKVKDAMTVDVIYCYPNSNAADVAATMMTAKIDSIPVLNSQTHALEGIITTTDLLDLICMSEELDGHAVRPFKIKSMSSRMDSISKRATMPT